MKQLKLKSTPVIAPKPRPWSMVTSEAKSSDLLSDGNSPANSTGNTPDSAEALDIPESSSSMDRRVAKELKLKRGSKFYRCLARCVLCMVKGLMWLSFGMLVTGSLVLCSYDGW